MPELPEMENYRNLLNARIAGKLITNVEIGREKSLNVPADRFIEAVKYKIVTTIDRRAKHLLFRLSSGQVLLLHLMLGGWMYYGTDEDKPDRSFQVILSFGEKRLYFIGLRLGYLHLHTQLSLEEALSKLGPEPLEPDYDLNRFRSLLRTKSGVLKTALVDQSLFAGIGNCYADELCFTAGVKPTKRITQLKEPEVVALFNAMNVTLKEALAFGGYMENRFAIDDHLTGNYNDRCKVYDNEGKPCPRCGTPIELHEVASRKCFYCPGCQK